MSGLHSTPVLRFLSTPSARRATRNYLWTIHERINFYPRPPRGGRPDNLGSVHFLIQDFYPRPPRGGRPVKPNCILPKSKFLSTPSARRATSPEKPEELFTEISIHALREEGDDTDFLSIDEYDISIHALREEGDMHETAQAAAETLISIHALREEGDRGAGSWLRLPSNFYPRPPRGGRRRKS